MSHNLSHIGLLIALYAGKESDTTLDDAVNEMIANEFGTRRVTNCLLASIARDLHTLVEANTKGQE